MPSVTDAMVVQLGHSATVSCHLNCSTVTWWTKGIEVFQIFKIFEFSEGKCTVAPEFKDRIECSEEKIRGGDVSLTLTGRNGTSLVHASTRLLDVMNLGVRNMTVCYYEKLHHSPLSEHFVGIVNSA